MELNTNEKSILNFDEKQFALIMLGILLIFVIAMMLIGYNEMFKETVTVTNVYPEVVSILVP